VSDWFSMKCPNCDNNEAIHTAWSEDDHEINCQECDLIEPAPSVRRRANSIEPDTCLSC